MRKSNSKKIFKEWGLPIIATLILFLMIRQFIFFTAIIPSSSMLPTLQVKDRLITSRIFSKDKLKRGDIVVFTGGGNHKHMHIKRLIGLPKDKLELKENGEIYVNGKLLDEPYVKYQLRIHNDECDHDHKHLEPNYGIYNVPEGKVFFLGDNRAESYDARFWDDPYVDMNQIIGKSLFRIWPLNRLGGID